MLFYHFQEKSRNQISLQKSCPVICFLPVLLHDILSQPDEYCWDPRYFWSVWNIFVLWNLFSLIHPNFDLWWSLWIKIPGQLPLVVPFATGGGGSLHHLCKHSDETDNSLWHPVCVLTTELWSRQLMCCWQLYSCNRQPKVEFWFSGIFSAETASFKSFLFPAVSVIIYVK